MGRDVTGIRTDRKPNPVKLIPDDSTVSQETAHVSPRISGLSVEKKKHEPNLIVNNSKVEENENKGDVLETKETEPKADSPKLKKWDSPPVKESFASTETSRADSESSDSTEIKNLDISRKSEQPNSPRGTRKPPQPDSKKQSASTKTAKFKTTVPVAPVFTCVARLEKRKQFYSKLEEKQAAMEAEKLEKEAKIKEKEEATIRQLRKNMVYKANPIPSFYREGPPPKTELKKLPVTRAKSPKLSRRKSCSDVKSRSSSNEKAKEHRHTTIDSHRNHGRTSAAPLKNRAQNSGKNGEATAKKSMDCSETVSEDTNNCSRKVHEDTNYCPETVSENTTKPEPQALPGEISADIS